MALITFIFILCIIATIFKVPVNLIITIYWYWHSVSLHILLHLHTISSITTSGSNNSCPFSIIHPCPSWLLVSFFVQNIFPYTFFLIIGPHSMKHKGTLNLQGGRIYIPFFDPKHLASGILSHSHRKKLSVRPLQHSLCPKSYLKATEATSSSSVRPGAF